MSGTNPSLSESPAKPARNWRGNAWLWGLIAVLVSCGYVGLHLQTGWFPHDEGQLGQSAERVLKGELPHRDFDEMYTGALTYLNALSFKLFGIRSESTRWMLFIFFVPFCGTLYWIARRACPPWAAALVTFFCSAISLPVYSAAIPSWYNLFFMTFGVASLLRFIDTRKIRWIVAAGLFAGFSILFKITGLYWLAAAILFLVYFEQQHKSDRSGKSYAYDAFVIGCLGLFALIGLGYSKTSDWAMASIHLTIPLFAIATFLGIQQLRTAQGPFIHRMGRLLKWQLPLIGAAMLPVVVFIAFYSMQGATSSLYEGLVVLPRQRVGGAHSPFPGFRWLLCSVPLIVIVAGGLLRTPSWLPKYRTHLIGGLMVGSLVLICFWKQPLGFQLTFQSFRNLAPFVAVVCLIFLALGSAKKLDVRDRSQLFLICVAASLACLVQFPFASDFYFMYAAPMVVLCVVFLSRWQPTTMRMIHAAALIIFVLFAVSRMSTPSPNVNVKGLQYADAHHSLGLGRCSLVVNDSTADVYQRVIKEIQKRTEPGEYIFAGPDFPEAYFFADRPNPTRVFYDFFRPELQQQPQRLIELLNQHDVRLVVLKKFAVFSKLTPEFEQAIADRFPNQKRINRYQPHSQNGGDVAFVIYWRDSHLEPQKTAE